jgi:hypothetical protein
LSDDREVRERRARGRRLAFTLAAIAVLVYLGFMYLTYLRG